MTEGHDVPHLIAAQEVQVKSDRKENWIVHRGAFE